MLPPELPAIMRRLELQLRAQVIFSKSSVQSFPKKKAGASPTYMCFFDKERFIT
jgi:hypothetical protein